MRVGIGYDSHRLCEGLPLVIGGQHVPFSKGLDGHSDADVLCHAVIDALLGAAHLGNIGARYPDTDPAYRGADSLALLRDTVRALCAAGWRAANIDATVLLERPKIAAYTPAMERNLALACELAPDCVSVKPKTNETLGDIGAGEGAAALAVCLIEPCAPCDGGTDGRLC